MLSEWHVRSVLTVVLLYALLAGWYSVTLPPGEGIDEAAHLDYLLFLQKQQRLPVQAPNHGQIDALMGHHPPLFYALGATLIAPIDTADRGKVLRHNPHFVWNESGKYGWNVMLPSPQSRFPWVGTVLALHVLRFLNVLFGAVSLIFVYLSVRLLLPNQQWAALGAAALVGLNPAFIYMNSTVHHDALLVMLNSAGIYWCVRYAARPVTLWALCAIGVLMSAAIMTKVSGIVLAPTVMLVLLLRRTSSRDWKNRFAQMLLVGTIVVLLSGWWFIRNQLLYGDPLGANVYTLIFQANMRQTPFTWGLFVHEFLGQMGRTFWGAFGFMHILMPNWLHNSLWAMTGMAMGGWLIVFGYRLARRSTIPLRIDVGWTAVIFFLIALFALYVRVATATLGAGHGRYLFPAGVAIGAILIGGLNGYSPPRHRRWISLGLVVAMTLYAILAPAYYVWPKYAVADTIHSAELDQATRIATTFEGGIELIAAKSSSAIVIPGQSVDVTTYWQVTPERGDTGSNDTGLSDTIPDVYVQMSLVSFVDDKPELFAGAAFWPEISTTPAVWGERIVANTQTFYFPPNQTPGNLLVQLAVTAGKDGKTLWPIEGAAIQTPLTLFELVTLGEVVPVSAAMLPAEQREERFADRLHLAAATIPEALPAGSVLPVVLYWQVLAQIEQDYTVFVHILNQNGEIVAQLDRPPGGGTAPTSTWQPGQLLQDTYPVLLPNTLPPGEYQVRMGLYTWPDLIRQPITGGNESAGDEPAADALLLGSFWVTPN